MLDTVFDIVLTGLLAAALRDIWSMSRDLSLLRGEFTLHRAHVEGAITDHETRLRAAERAHYERT